YGRLKRNQELTFHELARIWTESGNVVLEQIMLNERASSTPVDYTQTKDPTREQISRAQDILSQSGIENPQATLALMGQLRDPTFFTGLIEQANTVAQLHSALKNSFSGTGQYNPDEINRLIDLL